MSVCVDLSFMNTAWLAPGRVAVGAKKFYELIYKSVFI